MSKPVIVFTNFWDAEKLVKMRHFFFWDDTTLYKIRLNPDPKNYSVQSIALSHPPMERLPCLKADGSDLSRIDCFCPTYELLAKYKDDGDWSSYIPEYISILKRRKDRIVEWIDALKNDHVYILCCWENTSKKAHCHRSLIYDALRRSKTVRTSGM